PGRELSRAIADPLAGRADDHAISGNDEAERGRESDAVSGSGPGHKGNAVARGAYLLRGARAHRGGRISAHVVSVAVSPVSSSLVSRFARYMARSAARSTSSKLSCGAAIA